MFLNSALLILLTVALVALIDYIPRFLNGFGQSIKVETTYTKIPKYFIMPTVYGDPKYLEFIKNNPFLRRNKDKVLLCTTLHETKDFYNKLQELCSMEGFRYTRVNTKNKHGKAMFSAYAIYKGVFRNYQRLGINAKTPCLLMDIDTYTKDNLNNLIRKFIKEDLDISSLRCHIDKPKTLIEKLQQFEYETAMNNRKFSPWLTSGAASLGRAKVFKHIFSNHSDFFAGGDSEIGKIAKIMGYKIAFIDFLFLTEAPKTWKEWFNQRIIWFAGGFRHHVINMSSYGWQHFFLFFYNSLLIYILLPLRWIELINFPQILPVLLLLSWVYTFVLMTGRKWSKELLFLPIYSFIQSMIIIPFGIIRYIKLVRHHHSLGRLRYDMSAYSPSSRLLFTGLNIASAMMIIYIGIIFTISRIAYWLSVG